MFCWDTVQRSQSEESRNPSRSINILKINILKIMMPEWVNGVHYELLQGRFVRLLKESLYSSVLMFTR